MFFIANRSRRHPIPIVELVYMPARGGVRINTLSIWATGLADEFLGSYSRVEQIIGG